MTDQFDAIQTLVANETANAFLRQMVQSMKKDFDDFSEGAAKLNSGASFEDAIGFIRTGCLIRAKTLLHEEHSAKILTLKGASETFVAASSKIRADVSDNMLQAFQSIIDDISERMPDNPENAEKAKLVILDAIVSIEKNTANSGPFIASLERAALSSSVHAANKDNHTARTPAP